MHKLLQRTNILLIVSYKWSIEKVLYENIKIANAIEFQCFFCNQFFYFLNSC